MSRIMSEAMKRRWADPEWKARQRRLISKGLYESQHFKDAMVEVGRRKAAKNAAVKQQHSPAQPYRPGIDRRPTWGRE